MASARFLFNGTNNAYISSTLSPDSGSGYRAIGDGATLKYSTAQHFEGTASLTGTGGQALFFDDGAGNYISDNTATYVDFYAYIPSAPGSDTFLVGGTYFSPSGCYITSDRRLKIKKADGTSCGQTSANVVPTAAWFRIRAQFSANTGDGLAVVTLWTSPNLDDASVGTTTAVLTASPAADAQGFLCVGTDTSGWYFDDIVIQPVSAGAPTHPAGGTAHSASASVSTTATLTAAANLSSSVGASRSTAATVTVAAAVARFVDASVSETATVTASATRGAVGAASVATAATITASASVTSGSGAVAADVAVSESVSITAAASVARVAAASLSVACTVTAAATLSGHTTQGFMRPVQLGASSMRPRGGVSTPTVAALLSIDASTMTARVSTSAVPSQYGVGVFVGGSVSPVVAGLIPAGRAYVWFADDGVHVVGES